MCGFPASVPVWVERIAVQWFALSGSDSASGNSAQTRLGLKYEEKRNSKEWTPPAHLLSKYNRAELYEKVWSQPMRILAQQYGVSDAYLGRVCRLLRIPLPGLGYWTKKSAGRTAKKRPRLPLLPGEREEQETKH